MDPSLTIGGTTYGLVAPQQRGASSVYRGVGEYLRIGEKRVIERLVAAHKEMAAASYPLPELLGEDKIGYRYYFLEKSLGEKSLGESFEADCRESGVISEQHFQEFLGIVERFARAQMTTQKTGSSAELSAGIFLEVLCDELPEHADSIRERFKRAFERISAFPFVLSHGDFNPRNLFPSGVIDLEHSFRAPFGFDLVTALVHVELHPGEGDYEFLARYRYSDEQKKRYFAMLDSVAADFNLPPISPCESDFAFCRATWSTVRMHEWPLLQKWRYDKLIERFLA